MMESSKVRRVNVSILVLIFDCVECILQQFARGRVNWVPIIITSTYALEILSKKGKGLNRV